MAGSIKQMLYTSDTDEVWLVNVDESNGELFGFADYTGAEAFDQFGVPPGGKMRYVNWRADDGRLTRRFWVGTPDNTAFLAGGSITVVTLNGSTAQSIVGTLTSAVGEKRRLASTSTAGVDTGLTDGDAT
jgi:hypothetical protein